MCSLTESWLHGIKPSWFAWAGLITLGGVPNLHVQDQSNLLRHIRPHFPACSILLRQIRQPGKQRKFVRSLYEDHVQLFQPAVSQRLLEKSLQPPKIRDFWDSCLGQGAECLPELGASPTTSCRPAPPLKGLWEVTAAMSILAAPQEGHVLYLPTPPSPQGLPAPRWSSPGPCSRPCGLDWQPQEGRGVTSVNNVRQHSPYCLCCHIYNLKLFRQLKRKLNVILFFSLNNSPYFCCTIRNRIYFTANINKKTNVLLQKFLDKEL